MHTNAERTIMLIDSSKLTVHSLVQVMRLEEVDILVTDNGADPGLLDQMRQRGVDVRVAAVADESN